jgi:hypothetical protein
MAGKYVGQSGFSLIFHPESVSVTFAEKPNSLTNTS